MHGVHRAYSRMVMPSKPTPNPHSRTGCILRASVHLMYALDLPTHIHARGASADAGQADRDGRLPTHIHARGASIQCRYSPSRRDLPTHIHARGASTSSADIAPQSEISQPTFTHGVHHARWEYVTERENSQPTFTHGVHRELLRKAVRTLKTPNPHSRTGCIRSAES